MCVLLAVNSVWLMMSNQLHLGVIWGKSTLYRPRCPGRGYQQLMKIISYPHSIHWYRCCLSVCSLIHWFNTIKISRYIGDIHSCLQGKSPLTLILWGDGSSVTIAGVQKTGFNWLPSIWMAKVRQKSHAKGLMASSIF